jgi:hypothetical protein
MVASHWVHCKHTLTALYCTRLDGRILWHPLWRSQNCNSHTNFVLFITDAVWRQKHNVAYFEITFQLKLLALHLKMKSKPFFHKPSTGTASFLRHTAISDQTGVRVAVFSRGWMVGNSLTDLMSCSAINDVVLSGPPQQSTPLLLTKSTTIIDYWLKRDSQSSW